MPEEFDRPPNPTVANSFIGGHNIQLGYVDGNVTILLNAVDYRVEFLTATSDNGAHPPSDRPSYLLDPRHQVVPYRPRSVEQAQLQEWLTGGNERTSVLLVTGPAGQGKTRLAGHVATVLHHQGWAVAQAVPRRPQGADATSTKVLGPGQPLFVVVDYAERWQLDALTHLLDRLAQAYQSRRIRVLMLSRQGGTVWETIAAELDEIQIKPERGADRPSIDLANPIALGEFTAERAAAFVDAVDAFATRLGTPSHIRPAPPTNLTDAAYASPLTLHMAALATVYAAKTGDSGPDDQGPQALSTYLLRHERRYWHATTTAQQHLPAVPASTIEEAVWWATLCGPAASRRSALDFLRGVGLADGDAEAGRVLQVYERLYPAARGEPAGDAAATWPTVATMLPLQPDRLGEDFVGEYVATHDHAVERLADLAGTSAEDSPFDLGRCVIVLAAAAGRHPATAEALRVLLDRRPGLGASGGASVVRFVTRHAPNQLAERVCAELPTHPAKAGPTLPQYEADLVVPAVELTGRVLADLPADVPPEVRAHHLLHHGNRLAHAGHHAEASTAVDTAIHLYTRLARTDRRYQPHLTTAIASAQNIKFLDLLWRHELQPREGAVKVRLWPDGIALTTTLGRHFVAGSEPDDWLISKEDWVSDVVIAIRDDLIVEGKIRSAFLLLTNGDDVHVNDPSAVAELGRRLHHGMNPTAYAQLLAQFHPFTTVDCVVLTVAGQLRALLRPDLPDNEPVRLRRTENGLLLTFDVAVKYLRSRKYPVSSWKLDIKRWTVAVPGDGPAQWSSRLIAEGIRL